jgi:hypothetical protein
MNGRCENRNIICIGEIRNISCIDHCMILLKVTNKEEEGGQNIGDDSESNT